MKQISTALLETRVSRADPESSRWSTASRETGPSGGHLYSSDPEACRRDDPLQEHKASHSICSPPRHLGWGSASQRLAHHLLAALARTSSRPSFLIKLSLRCACHHPSFLSPHSLSPRPVQRGFGLWSMEHIRHGLRYSCYIGVNCGCSPCNTEMW